MSQAGIINVAGGGGGGAPIQTLTGNSGGAVPPTANNIFTLGGSSTANNAAGITVIGNPGGSTLTTTLTNRIQGTVTTSDGAGQTQTIATFPLGAVAGAYNVEAKFIGFNASTPASTGYTVIGTVRTTGAAGFLDGVPDETPVESIALITSDVNFVISGNNLILQVIGVAGLSIDWNVLATYVFVS